MPGAATAVHHGHHAIDHGLTVIGIEINTPAILRFIGHHHAIRHILNLQHQTWLRDAHSISQTRHALTNLQRRRQHPALADSHVRQVTGLHFATEVLKRPWIRLHEAFTLRFERNAGAFTETEPHGHIGDVIRPRFERSTVEPSIAGALNGGNDGHGTFTFLVPVLKYTIADL